MFSTPATQPGEAEYRQGIQFIKQAKYQDADRCFKFAASKGHIDALYNLGVLYGNGYSVAHDYKQAKLYWEDAASRGHASALFNLGVLYGNGYDVAQDYKQAKLYWEDAASRGHVDALFNLGALYENGCGVEKNNEQAFSYYEQALLKGVKNIRMLLHLSLLYANKNLTSDNLNKISLCFEQAQKLLLSFPDWTPVYHYCQAYIAQVVNNRLSCRFHAAKAALVLTPQNVSKLYCFVLAHPLLRRLSYHAAYGQKAALTLLQQTLLKAELILPDPSNIPKHRDKTLLKTSSWKTVLTGLQQWRPSEHPKVFISYAWENEKTVNDALQNSLEKLRRDLTIAGCKVFLDISDMEGDINQCMQRINSSHLVIVIITSQYLLRIHQKSNLQTEYQLTQEKLAQGGRVVAICSDGIMLPSGLLSANRVELPMQPALPTDSVLYRQALIGDEQNVGIIGELYDILPIDHRYRELLARYRESYLLTRIPTMRSDAVTVSGFNQLLHAYWSVSAIQALIGESGIGKQQIALQYVNHYQEAYTIIYVVRDGQRDLLSLASLLTIADAPQMPVDKLITSIAYKLRQYPSSLLIIVNISLAWLPNIEQQWQFMPERWHHVLLTSKISRENALYPQHPVTGFTRKEAVSYAHKRFSHLASEDRTALTQSMLRYAEFSPQILAGIFNDCYRRNLTLLEYFFTNDQENNFLVSTNVESYVDANKWYSAMAPSASFVPYSGPAIHLENNISAHAVTDFFMDSIAAWKSLLNQLKQNYQKLKSPDKILPIQTVTILMALECGTVGAIVRQLIQDIEILGFKVRQEVELVTLKYALAEGEWILIICTPDLLAASQNIGSTLQQALMMVADTIQTGLGEHVLPLYCAGDTMQSAVPASCWSVLIRELSQTERVSYSNTLLRLSHPKGLLLSLLKIDSTDKVYQTAVMSYRQVLANNVPKPIAHFIYRKALLDVMSQYVATYRYQVLMGASGSGKTQLALQFAEEHQESYSLMRWLDSDGEAFVISLRQLGEVLGLAVALLPVKECVLEVFQVLSRIPRWLLVFDNVTDTARVRKYLPPAASLQPGQMIIITSCGGDWSQLQPIVHQVKGFNEAVVAMPENAPASATLSVENPFWTIHHYLAKQLVAVREEGQLSYESQRVNNFNGLLRRLHGVCNVIVLKHYLLNTPQHYHYPRTIVNPYQELRQSLMSLNDNQLQQAFQSYSDYLARKVEASDMQPNFRLYVEQLRLHFGKIFSGVAPT